jgi:REP element-mobilizing transposase RayT
MEAAMSHTYVSQLMHCVFSSKERREIITPELQTRLWPYLGGIARENNMKALAIGGVEDHLHMLLSLPATLSTSKAIQLIKGGSSKWIHDAFPQHRTFAWQEGYGAFSIGISDVDRTIAYIENQATHHRKRGFKEEFLGFLRRHGIQYDERYLWG